MIRIPRAVLPFWTGLAMLLLAAAFPAAAQDGLLSDNDDGAPIEIEADDGIEWLREQKQYRAFGNATARRAGVTVVADTLTAYYRGGEEGESQVVYRLDAIGNVVITRGDTEVSGDKAVYHIDRKVAVVVGEDLQLITERGTITADDSLEYWEEKSIAVARGNAKVRQQDRLLQAGALTAFIRPTEPNGERKVTRIDATGGVFMSTPSNIVRGREGVYDVPKEQVTLCGDVKITRDDNQLNGECATVDMKSGRAKLEGGKGGKVKGLILPTQSQ